MIQFDPPKTCKVVSLHGAAVYETECIGTDGYKALVFKQHDTGSRVLSLVDIGSLRFMDEEPKAKRGRPPKESNTD